MGVGFFSLFFFLRSEQAVVCAAVRWWALVALSYVGLDMRSRERREILPCVEAVIGQLYKVGKGEEREKKALPKQLTGKRWI